MISTFLIVYPEIFFDISCKFNYQFPIILICINSVDFSVDSLGIDLNLHVCKVLFLFLESLPVDNWISARVGSHNKSDEHISRFPSPKHPQGKHD